MINYRSTILMFFNIKPIIFEEERFKSVYFHAIVWRVFPLISWAKITDNFFSKSGLKL